MKQVSELCVIYQALSQVCHLIFVLYWYNQMINKVNSLFCSQKYINRLQLLQFLLKLIYDSSDVVSQAELGLGDLQYHLHGSGLNSGVCVTIDWLPEGNLLENTSIRDIFRYDPGLFCVAGLISSFSARITFYIQSCYTYCSVWCCCWPGGRWSGRDLHLPTVLNCLTLMNQKLKITHWRTLQMSEAIVTSDNLEK
jgi:hypothetical protein